MQTSELFLGAQIKVGVVSCNLSATTVQNYSISLMYSISKITIQNNVMYIRSSSCDLQYQCV